MECNKYVERLIVMLESENASDNTIKRYRQAAEKFLKFSGCELSEEKAMEYLSYLRRKGFKSNYIRFNYYMLKALFRANKTEFNIKTPKIQDEPEVEALTDEEVELLLDTVYREFPLLDYIILRIAVVTGARRYEITLLDRDDLKIIKTPDGKEECYLHIKVAKHGEPRDRPLDETTCELLKSYLSRRKDSESAMFVLNNRRITVEDLAKMFREWKKRAGIKKKGGFHMIRRWYVTYMDNQGLPVGIIVKAMGWKTRSMALRYIKRDEREAVMRIAQIHPLFKKTEGITVK